ncbi:MAG: aminoglycoside phosphotransferase family protein [Betaproteobacteria bacterium]|nr:aminoglycoside phosphotransferase family protein [Betaproteobacteria bacterium]
MIDAAFKSVHRAVRSYIGGDQSLALELHALQKEGASLRTVVEILVHDADSVPQPLSLVGKCFPDESGAGTFRNMALLWQALAGRAGEATLAAPAPLAYDPAARCLIQQKVPGVAFAQLIDAGEFTSALVLLGRALAELHGCKLPLGAPRGLSEHMSDLIHPHPLELAEAWAPGRRRILDLVNAMSAHPALNADGIGLGPVHRDFHLRQVFLDARRVWMIDWDLLACGDPALDLGNFSMTLETRFGKQRGARNFDAFLSGYCALAGEVSLARVSAYRAFGYLRRASKSYRLGEPGWQGRSVAMLEAAESALEAA